MHKYRNSIPSGWKDVRNQLDMVKHIEKQLGIAKLDDWYQVKLEDFEKHNFSSFLRHFNHSIPKLLQKVYPNKRWMIWKFQRTNSDLWNDSQMQRDFLQELGRKFGYSSEIDWLSLSKNDIIWLGGGGLLEKMQGSLSRVLSIIFPAHPWKDAHFDSFPEPPLSSMREKLLHFEKVLHVKNWTDWYSIGMQDLEEEIGSSSLLSKFDSISNMVTHLLPEHPWKLFKFKELEIGFWKDFDMQRKCIEDLAEHLNIKKWPDDWKKVLFSKISQHECSSFISYYYQHSLVQALEFLYPEYEWKEVVNVNPLNSRKSEQIFRQALKDVFHDESGK